MRTATIYFRDGSTRTFDFTAISLDGAGRLAHMLNHDTDTFLVVPYDVLTALETAPKEPA